MDLRIKITTREIFLFSVRNFYRGAVGIASIIILVLTLFVTAVNWNSFSPDVRNILILAIALGGTGQLFMIFKRSENQAKAAGQGDTFMKLDRDGIRVRRGKERGQVPWDQILKAERISDFYVLYLSKKQAFLVPGSCLAGNRKEHFLDLLRKNIDADRRKRI